MSEKPTVWQSLLKAFVESCTCEHELEKEQIYRDFDNAEISNDIRRIFKVINYSSDMKFIYIENDIALIFTETTQIVISSRDSNETNVIFQNKLEKKEINFTPTAQDLEAVSITLLNEREAEIKLDRRNAARKDNFEKLLQHLK